MDESTIKLYYIWLGAACGFEPEIIELCCGIQADLHSAQILDAHNPGEYIKWIFDNRSEFQNKISRSKYKNKINLNVPLSEAEAILNDCEKQNIDIIHIESGRYPYRLRNIYCPPRFLFVKGDISGVDDVLGISVIGTRTATNSGIANAEQISYELSRNGVIITSGMARGIDTAAHMGAVRGGGRTFAVLAGGVDVVYPAENRDIYELICQTGAVISERPPHCKGQPRFYRQRNRIITGMSLGVLFVEGTENSGTAMSSRLAFENDRDIFAVPGSIDIVQSQLPNRLISEGAILVRGASDILNQYKYMYPDIEGKSGKNTVKKNVFKDALAKIKDIRKTKYSEKSSSEKSADTNTIRKKSANGDSKVRKKDKKGTSDDVNMKTGNDCENQANNMNLSDNFYESGRFKDLSGDDKKIIMYIGSKSHTGVIADDITNDLGISSTELTPKIIRWQIKGIITQQSGGKLFLKP